MEQIIIRGKKLQMSQLFIPVTVISSDDSLTPELTNKSILITGTSKGKGFAGVMKKWHFAGVGEATRGQSTKGRTAGSIGSQTPGRVFKGKKMAGRMGNKQVTVKGSKIIGIDTEKKEILVSGPVPGSRNSEVTLKVMV